MTSSLLIARSVLYKMTQILNLDHFVCINENELIFLLWIYIKNENMFQNQNFQKFDDFITSIRTLLGSNWQLLRWRHHLNWFFWTVNHFSVRIIYLTLFKIVSTTIIWFLDKNIQIFKMLPWFCHFCSKMLMSSKYFGHEIFFGKFLESSYDLNLNLNLLNLVIEDFNRGGSLWPLPSPPIFKKAQSR